MKKKFIIINLIYIKNIKFNFYLNKLEKKFICHNQKKKN